MGGLLQQVPSHRHRPESVMTDPAPLQTSPDAEDAILLMIKSQEARIAKLEDSNQKTLFKKMTASASASALVLGLVLSLISLYDIFVTKPEANRISKLSQFNQTVNSAAKTRQEILQSQVQGVDPKLQLATVTMATPRILNDLSTARAMLLNLDDDDVDIPQLIILISEAFTTGDLAVAKEFVSRAVGKTGATPYLRSEAKRYEGKFLFLSGDPAGGRRSFQEALSVLGDSPATASQRAYALGELVVVEFAFGDCESAAADLKSFATALRMPAVFPQARSQILAATREQLDPLQGQRCPMTPSLDTLLGK